MTLRLSRLDHFGIYVTDLSTAERFYTETLVEGKTRGAQKSLDQYAPARVGDFSR